jgi:hypothetical protein
MQSNLSKKIEKIFTAFDKIEKFPRAIIKYGVIVFLVIFGLSTGLVVFNHTVNNLDPYIEFVALYLVKTSFIILAEAVIGGLIIDYVFKK